LDWFSAKLYYGLTKKEAHQLALQYGKKNGIVKPLNALIICGSGD
jgi:hypothetical protein